MNLERAMFSERFSRLAIRSKRTSLKKETKFKPEVKKVNGFWSNLFFRNCEGIFEISKYRKLKLSDITKLPETCLAEVAMKDFEKIYMMELRTNKKKGYQLLRAIFKYKKSP